MGFFWIILIILIVIAVVVYYYQKRNNGFIKKTNIELECPDYVKNDAMCLGLFNMVKNKTDKLDAFIIYFGTLDSLQKLKTLDVDLYEAEKIRIQLKVLKNDCDKMINIAIKNSDLNLENARVIRETHITILNSIEGSVNEIFNL